MKIWSKPTAGNNSPTPGGATNLNDLADVAIASPVAGQIIKYDGGIFVNAEVPGLSDVQAQFTNLNADNIKSGTIDLARLPNLSILNSDRLPPYIESIIPKITSGAGSQNLSITGQYFTPVTQIFFTGIEGITITNYQVVSPTTITLTLNKANTILGLLSITANNIDNLSTAWDGGIKSINLLEDPYLSSVILHLKATGENNSINIIDSSPVPKIITRAGDTKLSNLQAKYDETSIYFDGSGDHLTLPNDNAFLLNTDFTIETWFYTGVSTEKSLLSYDTASGLYFNGTTFTWWQDGVGSMLPGHTLNIVNDQWHHVAVCKKNNLLSLFFNGSFVCSGNFSNTVNLSGKFIGRREYSPNFVGYMDSFRITKGIGRYTGNFNPEIDTFLNV